MDGVLSGKKNITNANLGRIVKDKVSDVAPVLDHVEDEQIEKKRTRPNLITSLLAGAVAGVVVDVALYPLDTIKTRLQTQQGFIAAGGFQGVYKGIVPVLIGSAPTSAIFFGSYNTIINYLKKGNKEISDAWIHFIAASFSETLSAIVRVPLEVLKQRKQTSIAKTTSLDIMKQTLNLEGFPGLYRGFVSTVARDVPFASIQFPLWEYLQKCVSDRKQRPVTTFEIAYCGAAAGGISAALTTPMDVLKTRTMLANTETAAKYGRLMTLYIARDIYVERGIPGLFAGLVPRVMWITIAGFIYLGMYEFVKQLCEKQTVSPVAKLHEVPCLNNVKELQDMEMKKKLIAQSSPTYMEVDDTDTKDLDDFSESEGGEMDFAEPTEFLTNLIS